MKLPIEELFCCWLTSLACLFPSGAFADDTTILRGSTSTSMEIDFSKHIYPILQRACFECHGRDRQEGGLRLDQRLEALESGIIEPGNSGESELLRRVLLPRSDDESMPAIGEPLTEHQSDLIRSWIEQGAVWPETLSNEKHWSYIAPRRPVPPPVSDPSWTESPIDCFVLQRLDQAGLTPAPRAQAAELVRRVFLDLIGLPPTPQEVERFVAQPSRERFERIVDDLLQRPQFGERWARPWLDLARYADSHGFQRDDLRDSWAYRDWVIRALNMDMPFDQFTVEQIAGDLLPGATESQKIATGFHRCAPTNVEAGSLPEQTRIEQVIDRVNTTGAVWLGTTLACCQCHDHKFDPFSMKDYYRLLAFYNNTEIEAERTKATEASSIQFRGPSLALSDPVREAAWTKLQNKLKQAQAELARRRKKLDAKLESWASEFKASADVTDNVAVKESVDVPSKSSTAKILSIVAKPACDWTKAERVSLLDQCAAQDEKCLQKTSQISRLEKRVDENAPDTTLVMIELDQPRTSTTFERGDYKLPGEIVEPGAPAILHPLPSGPPNRLTLAHWLIARQNPLVARVTVNRWWAELFGQGIVSTVDDFGARGEPPSHLELLDWLAVELMDQGWSRKRLLKTIVMSATYQQSSRVTRELHERDDLNRLLARGARPRMSAEMIRDNALAISGLLDRRLYGPPIYPYQPDGLWSKVGGQVYSYKVSPGSEQYRRGIYVVLKRGAPYPSFINFDATARLTCTIRRSRTNTPLQALTLLNDPVYVAAAKALAERVQAEKSNASLDQQLIYAFQLCVARRPTQRELGVLRRLYEEQQAAGGIGQAAENSAWFSVATTLLNLHETITKD